MDALADDIESILYIAREVMGPSPSPARSPAANPSSVPGASADLSVGLQSRRLERRGLSVEGPTAGGGDWRALRAQARGQLLSLPLQLALPPLEMVRFGPDLPIPQDSNTGELFASVAYVSPWTQVEPVLDSSRYFVLRVEGEGGKRAYIGMGFAERGEAFDFQVRPLTPSHRCRVQGKLMNDRWLCSPSQNGRRSLLGPRTSRRNLLSLQKITA